MSTSLDVCGYEFTEDIFEHPQIVIEPKQKYTYQQLMEGGVTETQLKSYIQRGLAKQIMDGRTTSTPGLFYIQGSLLEAQEANKKAYNEEGVLQFHVSNTDKKEGKIQLKLTEYKKQFVLLESYTDKDGQVNILKQIGQRRPDKRYKLVDDLTVDYHIYSFVNQGKQYLLLAEEEIPTGNCVVEGMVINAKFDSTILQDFKLVCKVPLYFAHNIVSKPRTFDTWPELINHLKSENVTYEKVMDYVGYHETDKKIYRQHPTVETLDMAWMLSFPVEGYSPARIRIGDPSTGKTKWAHSLHQKYKEQQSVVDGSRSTINGLVPSFKSTPPDPGAFLKSQRLIVIDEFFRMISSGNDEESRREVLGKLNSLIDRVSISFMSGNGSVKGKNSAKFYANTNPVYGTSNLTKLLFWLDQAFLSRCIPEYLGAECVEWVKTREHEYKRPPEWQPRNNIEWTDFIDCAEATESHYDERIVRKLIKKMTELTQDDLISSFLKMRMDHHANCLLDGIIKVRALKELNPTLEATKTDYTTLIEVLSYLGDNWCVVSSIGNYRVTYKEQLLTHLNELLDQNTPQSDLEPHQEETITPVMDDTFKEKILNAVHLMLNHTTPVDEAWFLESIKSIPNRHEWIEKLIQQGTIYRPKPGQLLLNE